MNFSHVSYIYTVPVCKWGKQETTDTAFGLDGVCKFAALIYTVIIKQNSYYFVFTTIPFYQYEIDNSLFLPAHVLILWVSSYSYYQIHNSYYAWHNFTDQPSWFSYRSALKRLCLQQCLLSHEKLIFKLQQILSSLLQ